MWGRMCLIGVNILLNDEIDFCYELEIVIENKANNKEHYPYMEKGRVKYNVWIRV